MNTAFWSATCAKLKRALQLGLLVLTAFSNCPAAEDEPSAAGDRSAPVLPTDQVINTVGMKLARIPAGEFRMGRRESPESLFAEFESAAALGRFFGGERPQHEVRITKPFLFGAHEVTVGQFRQFVEATGYKTDAELDGRGSIAWKFGSDGSELDPKCTWRNPGFAQREDHPVVCVSWNDATVFCAWLSQKEGKTYRLPTEAEWEFACRAGTVTRFHHGDEIEELVQVANVSDATAKANHADRRSYLQASDNHLHTAPVGSFAPNAWGLYDMHGNALEWCRDWYDPEYYLLPPPRDDPQGPKSGENRVVRGGCYLFRPLACRSAFRAGHAPSSPVSFTGFRVATTP